MKCLRPHVRSNAEQLILGIEDLVHETAMLAGLDHPHIIKVHGRAGNVESAKKSLSKSFHINDGYFILLDLLQDTLESRITSWKKIDMGDGGAGKRRKAMPTSSRLKTVCSIADALSYLFSKGVIFRDLKPANVGFDARGVLKLFDFGFAIEVDTVNDNTEHVRGVCGTQRYMAPENGLGLGYSFPADVYSFGILLWEICSLKKPFAHIKSPGDFRRSVFEKGNRPKLGKCWPRVIKDTIVGCWCSDPGKRPRMDGVSALLNAHVKDMQEHNSTGSLRKGSLLQRIQR
jgi:serine/threonine protein kinase